TGPAGHDESHDQKDRDDKSEGDGVVLEGPAGPAVLTHGTSQLAAGPGPAHPGVPVSPTPVKGGDGYPYDVRVGITAIFVVRPPPPLAAAAPSFGVPPLSESSRAALPPARTVRNYAERRSMPPARRGRPEHGQNSLNEPTPLRPGLKDTRPDHRDRPRWWGPDLRPARPTAPTDCGRDRHQADTSTTTARGLARTPRPRRLPPVAAAR